MPAPFRARLLAVALRVVPLCVAPLCAQADTLTVFAAASTRTALDRIAEAWEAESGQDVAVSYAGSSALARQIQQGAPADVFLSANPGWMDVLEADGLIDPATRADLLGNRIVLVAHGAEGPALEIGPETDLAGLLGEGRLAMALVEAVPAGIYGKAALEALGLWPSVAPRVAQADNVRAALALVATGEAPYGIVYATDAAAEPGVHVAAAFPEDTHPPIVYPVALVAGSDASLGRAFLDHLQGEAASAFFAGQGFAVLGD